MERDTYSARQALDDVRAGDRAVADRLITPGWYHPVLGLGLAGFILGVGLLPSPWMLLPIVLLAALCGWLIRYYRRLTGVWARPRPGSRSGWIWVSHSVITLACVVVVILTRTATTPGPAPLVIASAVIVATATMGLGPWLDRSMRAELRTGTTTVRDQR